MADEPPLEAEYDFEERFRHLPPTLYNRYLNSHRFLTRGKKLILPSPQRYSPQDTVSSFQPTTSRSRKQRDAPTTVFVDRPTASFRPPTSFRLPYVPSPRVSVDKRKCTINEKPINQSSTPKSFHTFFGPTTQSSTKGEESKDAAERQNGHDTLAEQRELIKTLGECMQIVFAQLQRIATSAPTNASQQDNDQLRAQVQQLQSIGRTMDRQSKKDDETSETAAQSAAQIEQSEQLPATTKVRSSETDDEQPKPELTDQSVDGRLADTPSDLTIVSEQVITTCPAPPQDKGTGMPDAESGQHLQPKTVNRRRRSRRSACKMAKAKHLLHLLVCTQLGDPWQQFYEYACNRPANLPASGQSTRRPLNGGLLTVERGSRVLKEKLSAKLEICHYKIYQKVHGRQAQVNSPAEASSSGSGRRYAARRLNKQVKGQSKYTLLMQLMNDASFKRFLMDKVNYFLRKRTDLNRQVKGQTVVHPWQQVGKEAGKDVHSPDCWGDEKSFFAIYKDDGQLTSVSSVDSAYGSTPASPCSHLQDRQIHYATRHPLPLLPNLNDPGQRPPAVDKTPGRDVVGSALSSNTRFRQFCMMFIVVMFVVTTMKSMPRSSAPPGRNSASVTRDTRRSHLSCLDWILLEADELLNSNPTM